MESNIGLIFGSETGNTEEIADKIKTEWGDDQIEIHNIFNMELSIFEQYEILILGIPSWYDGQLQGDWETIFLDLEDLNFKDRIVAVYGLGDQQDWGDYYCDAMGALAEKVAEQGAILIGEWPVEGYDYVESLAINEDGHFYGLALDEDCQPDLSEERIKIWVAQLKNEIKALQILDAA